MSVRVLSERIMIPGKEALVKEVMERVVTRVRRQPGFVRGDVLHDTGDASLYVILTEWESRPHLDKWLKEADYTKLSKDLDSLINAPVSYQMFERHREDMFLL